MAALLLTVSGCAASRVAVDAPVCGRAEAPARAHAQALTDDGGPRSVTTGRALLALLEAGCEPAWTD